MKTTDARFTFLLRNLFSVSPHFSQILKFWTNKKQVSTASIMQQLKLKEKFKHIYQKKKIY